MSKRKLTGAEIVVEMLASEGVPFAIGIGGHGNLPLLDALRRCQDRVKVIIVDVTDISNDLPIESCRRC